MSIDPGTSAMSASDMSGGQADATDKAGADEAISFLEEESKTIQEELEAAEEALKEEEEKGEKNKGGKGGKGSKKGGEAKISALKSRQDKVESDIRQLQDSSSTSRTTGSHNENASVKDAILDKIDESLLDLDLIDKTDVSNNPKLMKPPPGGNMFMNVNPITIVQNLQRINARVARNLQKLQAFVNADIRLQIHEMKSREADLHKDAAYLEAAKHIVAAGAALGQIASTYGQMNANSKNWSRLEKQEGQSRSNDTLKPIKGGGKGKGTAVISEGGKTDGEKVEIGHAEKRTAKKAMKKSADEDSKGINEKIDGLKTKETELGNDIQKLEKGEKALTKNIEKSTSELKSLDADIKGTGDKIKANEGKIEALGKELESLGMDRSDKLVTTGRRLLAAEERVEGAKGELSVATKAVEANGKEIGAIETEIQGKKEEIQGLENKEQSLTAKAEVLENEAGKIEKELDDSGIKKTEEGLEKLESQAGKLDETIIADKKELGKLKTQEGQLISKQGKIKGLEKEAETAGEKANTAKEKLTAATKERDAIQKKFDEFESKKSRSAPEIKADKLKALKENASIQAETTRTGKKAPGSDKIYRSNERKIKALDREDDARIANRFKTNPHKESLKTAKLKVKRLTTKSDVATKELGEIKTELVGAQREAGPITGQIAGFRTKMQALQTKITGNEPKLQALNTQIASTKATLTAQKQELAEKTNQVRDLNNKADGLRSQIETNQGDITNAENELKGAKGKLEKLEKNGKNLEATKEKAGKGVATAEAEKIDARAKLDEAMKTSDEGATKIGKDIQALQSENTVLKGKQTGLKEQAGALEETIGKDKAALKATQEELLTAKADLVTAQGDLKIAEEASTKINTPKKSVDSEKRAEKMGTASKAPKGQQPSSAPPTTTAAATASHRKAGPEIAPVVASPRKGTGKVGAENTKTSKDDNKGTSHDKYQRQKLKSISRPEYEMRQRKIQNYGQMSKSCIDFINSSCKAGLEIAKADVLHDANISKAEHEVLEQLLQDLSKSEQELGDFHKNCLNVMKNIQQTQTQMHNAMFSTQGA